jgi:hypothetical protein
MGLSLLLDLELDIVTKESIFIIKSAQYKYRNNRYFFKVIYKKYIFYLIYLD